VLFFAAVYIVYTNEKSRNIARHLKISLYYVIRYPLEMSSDFFREKKEAKFLYLYIQIKKIDFTGSPARSARPGPQRQAGGGGAD
jgi:hypothetical protein